MLNNFDDIETELKIDDGRISYHLSYLAYYIDGDVAVISAIDANPRGRGIGTMLYRKFEEIILATGCNIVEVPSSLSSVALSFWLAMGYNTQNKRDKKKIEKILYSGFENIFNDPQGVLVLEKQII
jgi:GNAT superfamily N-acetyltransferase